MVAKCENDGKMVVLVFFGGVSTVTFLEVLVPKNGVLISFKKNE
jgi:hypothetical protein